MGAPRGCLQYYTKVFDTIQSFNFDGTSVQPPNQDYAVCIRNEGHVGGRTCGITLRALNFGMMVGREDFPACIQGSEIVNLSDRSATRRYWCGKELGTTGQISGKLEPYYMKVHSGSFDMQDVEAVEKEYKPIGFQINYKVDTGIC